jgi:hypothetical protein
VQFQEQQPSTLSHQSAAAAEHIKHEIKSPDDIAVDL